MLEEGDDVFLQIETCNKVYEFKIKVLDRVGNVLALPSLYTKDKLLDIRRFSVQVILNDVVNSQRLIWSTKSIELVQEEGSDCYYKITLCDTPDVYERRSVPRSKCSLPILVTSESTQTSAVLVDVSTRGLCFRCSKQFAVGAAVSVQINKTISVTGTVVRYQYSKHGLSYGILLDLVNDRYLSLVSMQKGGLMIDQAKDR